MPEKVTRLHPDFLDEIRCAIDQLKNAPRGQFRDDPLPRTETADDIVVKTPEGGIDARDGTTVYSAMCLLYREVDGSSNTKTLEPIEIDSTHQTIRVWNFSNGAVAGDAFVATSRTKSGTRYVVVESCEADEE
jgi:hypothetical protein